MFPAPVPAVPGDPITATSIGDLANVPVFNIRNGPANTAVNIYIRPSIPEAYKWVPVLNLPVGQGVEHVGAFIRSAHAQLEANPPGTMTPAVRRKQAIVIGVARSVMCSYYQVVDNDITPTERVGHVYAHTHAVGPPPQDTIDVHAGADLVKAGRAQAMVDLTADEITAAGILMNASIGALPLQGYSMMMSGHHYLSAAGSASRKACDAVERQFWNPTVAGGFFGADIDEIRDALWHKAGHPVAITIKHTLAQETHVAAMLRACGAGSAAARLPAMEPALRTGTSYRALLTTVRPLLESYGGVLNFDLLVDAIDIVAGSPVTGGPPVMPAGFRVPAEVTDRASALAYLERVSVLNTDKVAFAYGFYSAMADANLMIGAGAGVDTLRVAFSLAKLKDQSRASYHMGMESYRDYSAAKNHLRQAGTYNAPTMRFSL